MKWITFGQLLFLLTSCGNTVDGLAPQHPDEQDDESTPYFQVDKIDPLIFEVPYAIYMNLGSRPNRYGKKLVAFLGEGNPSSTTLLKRIHDWIAVNMFYDYPFLEQDYDVHLQKVEETFRRRLAVCLGYSLTFELLAGYAGFEVDSIYGTVPGSNGTHAWNRVLLNGTYSYIDVTWDAGGFSKDNEVQRSYSTTWFMKTEAEFRPSHTFLQVIDDSLMKQWE